MKLIISILTFGSLFFGFSALAQVPFEIPETVKLAEMELVIREGARAPLQAYVSKLTANNRYFRQMVDRADAYLPIVERVFQEEGLPEDFKYLVIQESSLVSYLVSSSNAVGYWQFKKETALEMGLRVDDEIDERMNIVSSSRSAARYLLRHNSYMQNWAYSVLAYYAGLTGAKALIDPQNIGTKRMEVDENTHWYVLKFIAHKIAFEPHLYRNTTSPNLRVLEYTDCENKTIDQLAQETNYPMDQLQFYNRWILKNYVPSDKDYTLILPLKPEEGLQIESQVYVKAAPEVNQLNPWRERILFGLIEKPVTQAEPVVLANGQTEIPVFFDWNGVKAIAAKKGDNSAKLALLAGISRDEFLEYNDLRVFDPIVDGEVYYVSNKKNRSKVPFHTVKKGESLWEVSQKYGIKMKSLMAKNRMPRPEKLKAGRVLWLRHFRPDDEPIKYEPVPEPVFINQLALKKATLQNSESNTQAEMVQLRKVEAQAKSVLGADSLKAETPESFADQRISDVIEIEIVPETPKPVPTPAPVAIASTKYVPAPTPVQTRIQAQPIINTAPEFPKPENGLIEVKSGMTWFQISKQYKAPLDSLMTWNEGSNRNLQIGQKIRVLQVAGLEPVKKLMVETKPTSTLQTDEYEVKTGDTAYKIASRFGMKVEELLRLNQREDAALRLGEKLKVLPPQK